MTHDTSVQCTQFI